MAHEEFVSFEVPGYGAISARVARSWRAKRIALRFESYEWILSAPTRISLGRLQSMSQQFLPNLERFLAKIGPQRPISIPASIAIPFLGHEYQVKINSAGINCEPFPEDDQKALRAAKYRTAMLLRNSEINILGDISESDLWIWCFHVFFRKLAERHLPLFLGNLGRGYDRFKISIRNQKTRLGSCSFRPNASPGHTISLNWRAIFLPVNFLRHLCLHELTHLHHMNHSPGFYDELETKSPQCRKMEKELNASWNSMPGWVFARPDKSPDAAVIFPEDKSL